MQPSYSRLRNCLKSTLNQEKNPENLIFEIQGSKLSCWPWCRPSPHAVSSFLTAWPLSTGNQSLRFIKTIQFKNDSLEPKLASNGQPLSNCQRFDDFTHVRKLIECVPDQGMSIFHHPGHWRSECWLGSPRCQGRIWLD